MQRKRRYRRGSNSTLALLRRELREGNLQSFIGGSSYLGSLTTEADPLLSSFMYHQPLVDEPPAVLQSPAEDCSMKESSVDDFSERYFLIIIGKIYVAVPCQLDHHIS